MLSRNISLFIPSRISDISFPTVSPKCSSIVFNDEGGAGEGFALAVAILFKAFVAVARNESLPLKLGPSALFLPRLRPLK